MHHDKFSSAQIYCSGAHDSITALDFDNELIPKLVERERQLLGVQLDIGDCRGWRFENEIAIMVRSSHHVFRAAIFGDKAKIPRSIRTIATVDGLDFADI
jgi:hypothetical protein